MCYVASAILSCENWWRRFVLQPRTAKIPNLLWCFFDSSSIQGYSASSRAVAILIIKKHCIPFSWNCSSTHDRVASWCPCRMWTMVCSAPFGIISDDLKLGRNPANIIYSVGSASLRHPPLEDAGIGWRYVYDINNMSIKRFNAIFNLTRHNYRRLLILFAANFFHSLQVPNST